MPELVQDGVNGFLVDAPDEAARALEAAGTARPRRRPRVGRARFDVRRMVDEYIDVYRRIADRTKRL